MKTLASISKLLCALCTLSLPFTAWAEDLHVPASFATIQEAVDAASDGDTIHIAAGVYVEQTRISRKNLTLVGEPGTILRAFPNMEDATPDNNSRCILFILLSSDVNVRNLTFEGDQLADQQGDANNVIGVYHLDSGGSVENCRFTGFRERLPGPGRGRAIRCRNDLPGAPLYSYRVVGNTIVDSYKGLEVVGAPDKLSLEVTLENNQIRGVGPTPNSSGQIRGMDLGDGITGSVTGNTISGFSYTGQDADFPWGWGIYAAGRGIPPNIRSVDPLRFENNTFADNNLHLVLLKGDDCQILNNRFSGTGPGLTEAGLWFSGKDVEVRGNSFRDMPTGIIVAGRGLFGTDLGIAVDAVLTDNRFSDVQTTITHQELSSATEEGTLIPFPDPELEIETAIRLSWPSYYENWSVQSSLDLETWNLLDLPIQQHEGQSLITVPADTPHKFFRLIEATDSP